MLRFNGQALRAARLNGRSAKVMRLNGEVVWTSGIRYLNDKFDSLTSTWRTACDPASERAWPFVSGGILLAGVPGAMYSGKPAQSVYTREEADNAVGTWTFVLAPGTGTAGLYSGVILGTDTNAGRMAEVVLDRNGLLFRFRTSQTNSWVTLGSSSVAIAGGETVRVERSREGDTYRVRAYVNNVLRGNWLDSSRIPGEPGGKFIGLRLQADRNFFTQQRSPSITEFTFTAA